MHYQPLIAATLLAVTAKNSNFHIGPWIIVPILILIAIIGTLIYIVRDRRKRRPEQLTR
jgi:Flp pilus assembly protein TadB